MQTFVIGIVNIMTWGPLIWFFVMFGPLQRSLLGGLIGLFTKKKELKIRIGSTKIKRLLGLVVLNYVISFIGVWLTSILLKYLNAPTIPGNTGGVLARIEELGIGMVEYYWRLFYLTALREEMIYRIVPFLIFYLIVRVFFWQYKDGMAVRVSRIAVLVLSSLIFSIAHLSPDISHVATTSLLVVLHFLSGLVFWYTMEEEGVVSVVAVHYIYDVYVFGISLLMETFLIGA